MCKDIHDPILLSQYRQNPERYMFEIDAYTELKRFLDDIDAEIKHKTLKNTNTEKYLKQQVIFNLSCKEQRIAQL